MIFDAGSAVAGFSLAVVILAVVFGLVVALRPTPEPPMLLPPPAEEKEKPKPVVEVRTEIQRVEVPAPDPLSGTTVYVRVDWKVADAYLRGLSEFGGADGYTREFLANEPRFLSSSYAGEPFFLWRRDFYLNHRDRLAGK